MLLGRVNYLFTSLPDAFTADNGWTREAKLIKTKPTNKKGHIIEKVSDISLLSKSRSAQDVYNIHNGPYKDQVAPLPRLCLQLALMYIAESLKRDKMVRLAKRGVTGAVCCRPCLHRQPLHSPSLWTAFHLPHQSRSLHRLCLRSSLYPPSFL